VSFVKIIITSLFLIFFNPNVFALDNNSLLSVEQAFKLSAKVLSTDQLEISWKIADGYYLYRDKIKLQMTTPSARLTMPVMPTGESKQDPFLGETVIYRHTLRLIIPVNYQQPLPTLDLTVKFQGCADQGVCYPPQTRPITLKLPAQTQSSGTHFLNQLLSDIKQIKSSFLQTKLLPAQQAFQFFATVVNANKLQVKWHIAEGYYLYRDKIKLRLINTPTIQLGHYTLPNGEPYHDETFGSVEIFYRQIKFDIPLIRQQTAQQTLILRASYQGCADRGVCYPPMDSEIKLVLPETQTVTSRTASLLSSHSTEQDKIFQSLKSDSFGLTLLSFFGFGLLLAFTPCIFPMIPILSGLIVGQGKDITTRKAFLLSLCYVIASALTYTAFGVLAALFGSNLQATFQQPWIIAVFSGLFIFLALSMFGFYQLELPKSLQTKLHHSSDQHRDGSYLGAAIMGVFSSLIVGPCVAAPLAGALIYIGQTGDVVLGGSALFIMGFAMNSPLLLLGASAASLLPKAGHWLNSTKAVFGVIMLAVALWMLERILPTSLTMFLVAALLIIPAIYLHAIDPVPEPLSGWQKFWKGCGVLMFVYGVLILIGLSMGQTNPLQPLKGIHAAEESPHSSTAIQFKTIHSLAELELLLQQAQAQQQWLMLDFYADWCISCQEMEAYTFNDQRVKRQLNKMILVQADVTENSADNQALLKHFNLIGPPAILFFSPMGQEVRNTRVIGYQESDVFLQTLNQLP